MDDIVTSTETQTTTSEPSIRDQMLEAVEQETKESQEDQEEGKDTDEKTSDKEETSEKEPSDEDDDKEEEEEKSEDEPAKKPNRYRRLKAKLEASTKQAEKFSSERDEAVKYANIYRQRLLALQQRYESLKEGAEKGGLKFNPLDEENFRLKLSEKERELSGKIEESMQQERMKEQIQQAQMEMTYNFAQEALSVASKFTTDKAELKPLAQKILKAHAVALRADPDATLADTAKLIMAMNKSKNPESQQRRANDSAPQTMTKRPSGLKPTFKDRTSEALAFMDAELKGE